MRNKARFSPRLKQWFYGIFGVLFFSGALWLVLHYCTQWRDEFGTPKSLAEPWLLKIHGAAAMASLLVLGVLIPMHMQRAWEQRRNRITAIVMVSACSLLIVSGYGLYYSGSETLRPWISALHSIAGCLLPLALIWHITTGREQRSSQVHKSS